MYGYNNCHPLVNFLSSLQRIWDTSKSHFEEKWLTNGLEKLQLKVRLIYRDQSNSKIIHFTKNGTSWTNSSELIETSMKQACNMQHIQNEHKIYRQWTNSPQHMLTEFPSGGYKTMEPSPSLKQKVLCPKVEVATLMKKLFALLNYGHPFQIWQNISVQLQNRESHTCTYFH